MNETHSDWQNIQPNRRFLDEMVRMKPVSVIEQNDMAEFLCGHFIKEGLAMAEIQETHSKWPLESDVMRKNVYMTLGSSPIQDHEKVETVKETLTYYAHLDVVPPSDRYAGLKGRKANQVTKNPNVKEAHKLYGLGTEDMLGGIAAIEHAARIIKEFGVTWTGRQLRILFTFGEEAYSEGFDAAQAGDLFKTETSSHCVLTPEILVNKRLLNASYKQRAMIVGRLGLSTFTVGVNGREEHCGSVDKERKKETTEYLERQARQIITEELDLELNPYPSKPDQYTIPDPSMHITEWHSDSKSSLTVPPRSEFLVAVHTADKSQTPEQIVDMVRDRLRKLAAEIFPGATAEARKMREEAFSVIPNEHPVSNSQPSMEDPNNPFVTNMRNLMSQAYKESGGRQIRPRPHPGPHLGKGRGNRGKKRRGGRSMGKMTPDEIVAMIVDSGTADCPRIANDLGIPIIGTPVTGGGSHTHLEWLDWRSVKEVGYLYALAAHHPKVLAPTNWDAASA